MINKLLGKVFGTKNERELKRVAPIVARVNELESSVRDLPDEQLAAKTVEFRARLQGGATLDDLLPEAFAVCREAAKRVLGMRHFDVQLIGGIFLHEGTIAEMRTGEGKTLVATAPVYLNALTGRGVHVVTVNDYLARRDADWMGRVYRFLGLSVGCIQHNLDDEQRRQAYGCDVTYGTNNEFGFDYLRDNMKFTNVAMVQQKGHVYAIVDEVDSILVDEARTPLIISGPSEGDTSIYGICDRIVPSLIPGAKIAGEGSREQRDELEASGDYITDIKNRSVTMTEGGVEHAEKLLGVRNLYDPANIHILHAVTQALRAHALYERDVDYLIEDGEVIIIDEFTGRKMPGRRWSDGLHQAVEAKEKVEVRSENQTLATITFQNYFRMYEKLSGMTGTAETEAAEFAQIYKLDVMVIPTNRPMVRKDFADMIFRSEEAKYAAVVEEVKELYAKRQPVLVGTTSVEKSERLSSMLKKAGVPHAVLNAKYHAQEAEIVAQAGRLGAITIATNMAGRGTDILLGGNPESLAKTLCLERSGKGWNDADEAERQAALAAARETCAREHDEVVRLGGLHIIGTERHEARRIDNQLRGRAGRQGDPGASRFYLSLEDDLMKRFASWLMQKALEGADDAPIESGMVSRSIEKAQKQVEAQNFEIRKRLLEYDDVQNLQRQELYGLRRDLLQGGEQREYVMGIAEQLLDGIVDEAIPEDKNLERREDELAAQVLRVYGFDPVRDGIALSGERDDVRDRLWERIKARYEDKEARVGPEMMRRYEQWIVLQVIDGQWKDHLLALDHLKEGISMRAYGQKDPLVEYKRESFTLFAEMKQRIEEESVKYLMLFEPVSEEERRADEERRRREQETIFRAASAARAGDEARQAQTVRKKTGGDVGRNDPCPCGSGKKFKKCHGALAGSA